MPLLRAAPNPILRPADIPPFRPDLVDVSSVFNPGATLWKGREVLLLRVQTRGRTTLLLPAERTAGGATHIHETVLETDGFFTGGPVPQHVYDPRLTVLDGDLYAVLACDFADGCRLLTLRTRDFDTWEFVSLDPDGDRRNGVLFPEKVGGNFLRLQRSNSAAREGAPPTGHTISLAASSDLVSWRDVGPIMEGRPGRWDELIGSGPPPVKTRDGWLHIYHGVATHFAAANIYQAGVVLLDLADPSQVVARGAFNILEPREPWELTGQVPNVVFPGGMVVDQVDEAGFALGDSPVRVYYGAADTVIGLAETTLGDLIADAHFQGV